MGYREKDSVGLGVVVLEQGLQGPDPSPRGPCNVGA